VVRDLRRQAYGKRATLWQASLMASKPRIGKPEKIWLAAASRPTFGFILLEKTYG
jgi:hypothetical protein